MSSNWTPHTTSLTGGFLNCRFVLNRRACIFEEYISSASGYGNCTSQGGTPGDVPALATAAGRGPVSDAGCRGLSTVDPQPPLNRTGQNHQCGAVCGCAR